MPSMAEKLSWKERLPTEAGSATSTPMAESARAFPGWTRREPAAAMSAAPAIHTARRAGTPQSARSA